MACPKRVLELAALFERNKSSYLRPAYNEAQLREEFVNPFFEALGWDVRNIEGNAEAYKDVIHVVKNASYVFDEGNYYSNDKTSIIPIEDRYLIGLLNSKLLDFFIQSISSTKQGGYYEYKPMYLAQLPIRVIDFFNHLDKTRHDSLVSRMLVLHRRLAGARTPQEKKVLERQIEAADDEIDGLVYKLYGLSEDEIKIVEDL